MQAANSAGNVSASTSPSPGTPLATNVQAGAIGPAAGPAASQPLSSHPTSAHTSRPSTSHRSVSRSSHAPSTFSASPRGSPARPAPGQTPAATTTSTSPPPPAAQATTSSTAPSSTAPAKPLRGLPHQHTRVLRSCKYLLLASSLYALALGVTLTVSFKHTLLGAVSLPAGIFLLNLISKSGDVAFVLAIGEVFENLLWGRLGKREVVPLTKVLALSGTTGVHGFARIAGGRTKMGSTRVWALLRLIGVLIAPGPGLLLMANVNPELYYFPENRHIANSTLGSRHTVSAGIGAFQPSAAVIWQEAARIHVPLLVQTLLQNENVALPSVALSSECQAAGSSCSSTMLTGGLQNVRPLFSRREDAPAQLAIVEKIPGYQFDVWPGLGGDFERGNGQCAVYGGADPRFELCIANDDEVAGQLQISWRSCPRYAASSLLDPLPDPTSCADIPSDPDLLVPGLLWTHLNLRSYNRTATQIISTSSGSIQQLQDVGSATPLTIQAHDLFEALDVLLWPASQNQTNLVNNRNLQWGVTVHLASTLEYQTPALSGRGGVNNAARQMLCNTVLMPLFLFHDLYMGIGGNLGGLIEEPQRGLGDSFYVSATYAYSSVRPTPAFWTILAYAAVGGFILVVVLVGQIWALWQYPVAEISAFPLLDLGASLKVIDSSVPGVDAYAAPEERLADRFRDVASSGHVIKHARRLQVVARRP